MEINLYPNKRFFDCDLAEGQERVGFRLCLAYSES